MTTENPYTDDEKDRQAAEQMDAISRTVFAPVYPLLAEQIRETHGVTEGVCVDLGSGPGMLSIHLARITDLEIYAVDMSRHSRAIAEKNIEEAGLSGRITPVTAKVSDMPFGDGTVDLIVSRGSIFFWQNLVACFNEIYRILKVGGKTHIGGGFGSEALKKSIFETMAKEGDGFAKKVKNRMNPENMKRIQAALDNSRAADYTMSRSEAGFWIHIAKAHS